MKEEELKRIEIREQIKKELVEAMEKFKNGDKAPLRFVLKYIHNHYKRGFTVHKGLELNETLSIDGDEYNSSHAVVPIRDMGKIMGAVYQCQKSGETKLFFDELFLVLEDEEHFLTPDEIDEYKLIQDEMRRKKEVYEFIFIPDEYDEDLE